MKKKKIIEHYEAKIIELHRIRDGLFKEKVYYQDIAEEVAKEWKK